MPAISLMLLLLIPTLFASYFYWLGIFRILTSAKESSIMRVAEDKEAIQWIIGNTSLEDVVICYRDPLYYLYTGRKATRSSPLGEGGRIEGNKASNEERARSIFRIIAESNGKYLVLTSTDLELESQAEAYQRAFKDVLNHHPKIFVTVFQSTDARCVIYRIDRVSIDQQGTTQGY
jgi:hypothetical protein